uniref:Uncharacterized protein n=1 Tax=Octopus bimaculoides TaxID=37653 RepID=A0A0L8GCS9_OCTBM
MDPRRSHLYCHNFARFLILGRDSPMVYHFGIVFLLFHIKRSNASKDPEQLLKERIEYTGIFLVLRQRKRNCGNKISKTQNERMCKYYVFH